MLVLLLVNPRHCICESDVIHRPAPPTLDLRLSEIRSMTVKRGQWRLPDHQELPAGVSMLVESGTCVQNRFHLFMSAEVRMSSSGSAGFMPPPIAYSFSTTGASVNVLSNSTSFG